MVRLPLICLFLLPAYCFADPIPKSARRQTVKVEGTTWEGVDSNRAKCIFTFHKGGMLEYDSGDMNCNVGTWKLEGEKMTWQFNNQAIEDIEGVVTKDEIKMECHNIKGLKWAITFKPVKDDKQGK